MIPGGFTRDGVRYLTPAEIAEEMRLEGLAEDQEAWLRGEGVTPAEDDRESARAVAAYEREMDDRW